MVVSMVVVCACVTAQADEVLVNERTSGSQANPAIAVTPDGGAVIVWSSYYSSSGRSNDIIARRLDPNGTPVGGEFLVNADTQGNQTEPAIAVDGAGNVLVVWQGPGLAEEDIFLRILDPNAVPLVDELLINATTAGRQIYPRIAASDAAGFVVAWESRIESEDGDLVSIHAQRFDANGLLTGPELWIDEDVYDCRYPDVGMDATGAFVVTWLQDRTNKTIFARHYDPNGSPATDARIVSEAAIASLTRPTIAMNARGDFAVVWDGDPNRAGDDDVHVCVHEPNGTPRLSPFIVNELREGAQRWPRVAIDDANEFVVVWEHETGDPNTASEIHAVWFGSAGQVLQKEFPLNTAPWGQQQYPTVAMSDDGAFVAAWECIEPDGTGYDVFARAALRAPMTDPNGDGNMTLLDVACLGHSWRTESEHDVTLYDPIDPRGFHLLHTQWPQGLVTDD
jgi:hypothetical protein